MPSITISQTAPSKQHLPGNSLLRGLLGSSDLQSQTPQVQGVHHSSISPQKVTRQSKTQQTQLNQSMKLVKLNQDDSPGNKSFWVLKVDPQNNQRRKSSEDYQLDMDDGWKIIKQFNAKTTWNMIQTKFSKILTKTNALKNGKKEKLPPREINRFLHGRAGSHYDTPALSKSFAGGRE